MERKAGRVSRRWRTAALVAIGVAIGTTMTATPISGHVGGTVGHLWRDHIKAKTEPRYANAVPGTDKANDADKLDGLTSEDFIRVGGSSTSAVVGLPDCNPGIDYLVRSFTAPRAGWALVNASFSAVRPGVANIEGVAARLERQTDSPFSLAASGWQEETLSSDADDTSDPRANIAVTHVFSVAAGTNHVILKVCDGNDVVGAEFGSSQAIEGQLTILYSPFLL
jgi:hypothetical protein